MSTLPGYAHNRASAGEIAAHLRRCDAGFRPPLSGRVDIDGYAAKLAAKSERFEAWSGVELVGLLAVYGNDPGGDAFITSVSVVPDRSGRGIGGELLRRCIAYCAGRHARRIALEVSPLQGAAIRLYERHGFTAAADCAGPALTMHLLLEND